MNGVEGPDEVPYMTATTEHDCDDCTALDNTSLTCFTHYTVES